MHSLASQSDSQIGSPPPQKDLGSSRPLSAVNYCLPLSPTHRFSRPAPSRQERHHLPLLFLPAFLEQIRRRIMNLDPLEATESLVLLTTRRSQSRQEMFCTTRRLKRRPSVVSRFQRMHTDSLSEIRSLTRLVNFWMATITQSRAATLLESSSLEVP